MHTHKYAAQVRQHQLRSDRATPIPMAQKTEGWTLARVLPRPRGTGLGHPRVNTRVVGHLGLWVTAAGAGPLTPCGPQAPADAGSAESQQEDQHDVDEDEQHEHQGDHSALGARGQVAEQHGAQGSPVRCRAAPGLQGPSHGPAGGSDR